MPHIYPFLPNHSPLPDATQKTLWHLLSIRGGRSASGMNKTEASPLGKWEGRKDKNVTVGLINSTITSEGPFQLILPKPQSHFSKWNLRPKEVNSLFQGYTRSKWWNQNEGPDCAKNRRKLAGNAPRDLHQVLPWGMGGGVAGSQGPWNGGEK